MSDTGSARLDASANHVALRVRDLDAALRFYRDLIGLPVTRIGKTPSNEDSVWLPGLQLIHDPNLSAEAGGRLDHLALGITNVEEVCQRLDAAGFEADTPLQHRTAEQVGRPLTMAFYRDPEGNRVELLRYDD